MRKHRASGTQIVLLAASVFFGSLTAGCDEKVAQYRDTTTSAASTASAAPPPTAKPDKLGARKRKNRGEAPVYIDGELVTVMRYGELPPGFEPEVLERRGEFTKCNLAAYLTALGVSFDEVKAVHLEGSGRTAAIDGDELRRHKDTLGFTFTKARGTAGKPMMDWPSKKVKSTTRVDKVSAMYVFFKKEPPQWNRDKRAFFWEDGREVQGKPYIEGGERVKIAAARVYIDGKLHGFVDDVEELPEDLWATGTGRGSGKTTDASSEEDEDEPVAPEEQGGGGGGKKVLLAKYLAHRGIKLDSIKAIEIIGEDRVLARYDRKLFDELADALAFGVPRRKKKKSVRLEVDEPASPYPGPINAQAIAVYIEREPTKREIALPRRRPRRK